MKKIKLTAPLALFLCAFSAAALFAEGDGGGEGSGGGSVSGETVSGETASPAPVPDAPKLAPAQDTIPDPNKKRPAPSPKKTPASPAPRSSAEIVDTKNVNTLPSAGTDSNNEKIEDKEASIDSSKNETAAVETKIDPQEKERKSITHNLPPELFFGVMAGVLLLLIVALFIIGRVQAKKSEKKISGVCYKGLQEIKEKLCELEQKINHVSEVKNEPQSSIIQDNSAQYRAKIADLERRNKELENENKNLQSKKNFSDGVSGGAFEPVTEFNRWAANPELELPDAFYYLEGNMQILTKQALKESGNTNSKWIANRKGDTKYLFPNPNSFNQMTDSDLLYTIRGSTKVKGQNRINITKACKMTNEGWVAVPGELEILP
jgi:hypothetical protein